MKNLFAGAPRTKFIAAASAFTWLIAIVTSADAAELKEARVTQVVNDVKLLLEKAAPRPAAVSDLIRKGAAVRTGTQSRTELTFADLTITRLGANTIFSFNEGTREMNLTDGAILFQVPKGSGGATIRTIAVTAAITGTTGIAEFHPATAKRPQPISKWLCLEGMFRLYLPNGQSVEVGPGKMVTTDGKSVSKVRTFDIAKLVSTSLFFTGFDTPLASLDLIMLEAQNQLVSNLFTPTNPLDPIWILNKIDQGMVAEETPTPPPPPSETGTPSVITTPVPYLITSGTVITTDHPPTITTNGATDFGKIYRGPVDDGAFSLWAFGSTSPFDAALDMTFFADPNHLPLAAFKFQSISITGNPTIDLSNGGVTKLGLIGVDGITSGPPGGTLTFTGLDLLVLATVNGSINLTSDVSFQNLSELAMYARGPGSNLTLDSPISNIGALELAAEGSIHLTNPGTMSVGEFDAITGGSGLMLQIGGSLLLNGKVRLDAAVSPGTTLASGANLTLSVTGDYTNNSATESSRLAITNQGHIGTGGNILVSIGRDLTTGSDFSLVVQNTNGQIDNGGNITLNRGGNLTINGGGTLSLLIANNDGGHIGTGGNISVTPGGDLTAGSIDALINNRNGGSITSGANLIFNVGGALSTTGDASFVISSRNDGNGGGIIGGDVALILNAARISVGNLVADVSTNTGGRDRSSTINLNRIGNFITQGYLDVEVENEGFNVGNVFLHGGIIQTDAVINVSASNISTVTGYFNVLVGNEGGGQIGGSATINVAASNAFNIGGTAFFDILNAPNGSGTPAGTIGSNAIMILRANSASIGGLLQMLIDNSNGGSIGGSAAIGVLTPGTVMADGFTAGIVNNGGRIGGNALSGVEAGSISITGNSLFQSTILNQGGTITGNAEVGVNPANITANSLLVQIDNSNSGVIGGTARIDMNASVTGTIATDATAQILGSDGAASAEINIQGNYNVGGTFLANIDGNGTITFNNASAHADVLKAGVFGTNGVLKIGGGTLSADSILKLYAPGSNGALNFVSNVTLGGNSMMKILAANSITIFNNVVVTIGGPVPADVYVNFVDGVPNANYTGFGGNGTTTGTFGGAGANKPQPLSNAPPFSPASPVKLTTGGKVTAGGNVPSGKKSDNVINVRSSDELLTLLDRAAPGPGGKITIAASKSANNSKNSNRIDPAGRLNAGNRVNVDRRATDMRTASSSVMRRSPQ